MPPHRPNDPAPVSHTGVLTRERVTTIALLIATAIAVYLCYRIVYPFMPALTWALALAVVARPMHHWIAGKIRYPGVAAGVSVTLVTLLLLTPLVLLTWQIVSQASQYAQTLEKLEKGASPEKVVAALDRYPQAARIAEWAQRNLQIEQGLQQALARVGQSLSATLSGSFWVVVQLLITLLVLFFLFRDEPQAVDALREYLPLSSQEKDDILARLDDTIHATIYGTLVVAAVQGALGGLMFWFLGLPAPAFWGFVMAVMAVVPYLGAFVIWAPAAVYLIVQGEWGKAALLTGWGTVVVGLIDNLLYPMLVGKRLRQHTLVAFFAIIGGLTVFGASGLVLGPVIVTTTAALIDVWWRRTARGHAADANVEQTSRTTPSQPSTESPP
jgi:predicted PurR-regulated permease PerM